MQDTETIWRGNPIKAMDKKKRLQLIFIDGSQGEASEEEVLLSQMKKLAHDKWV